MSPTDAVSPREMGLWGPIVMWRSFLQRRTGMITRRLKEEISYAVQKYYEASGELRPTESFPIVSIHKDEVPEPLSRKIRSIEEQYRDDARASNPSGKPFKEMLLTTSHSERLHIFRGVLENELSRLTARAAMEDAIADCRRDADGTNDGRTSDGRNRRTNDGRRLLDDAWVVRGVPLLEELEARNQEASRMQFQQMQTPLSPALVFPPKAADENAEIDPQMDAEIDGKMLSWHAEWQKRLSCWWRTLPPTMSTNLIECTGAIGLHLSSRLEAAWQQVLLFSLSHAPHLFFFTPHLSQISQPLLP